MSDRSEGKQQHRVVRSASMPFTNRRRSSEEDMPNAIVGAARRVHLNRREEIDKLRVQKSAAQWQKLAWLHYDGIGEVKYAYNYFAAVASRIRLYVGYENEEGDPSSPIGDIADLDRSFVTAARYELSKLSNGIGGQSNFIRKATLNLLVPGECYLTGVHGVWEIRSSSELRFDDGQRVRLVQSRYSDRLNGPTLPESAYVARIWRTHPEYTDDADSSLKGIRDDCDELLLLSRIIRASAQSRLNAGILYVADELRFQRASDPVAEQASPEVDPFEEELTLTLTEPVGETDSPSEIVPMIVRGPAAFADNGIKHIDISRGFDESVVDRHEKTLSRVLNGLDLPRDLVTGLANVRYSNAQTITEEMLKSHVEPLMLLLCEALTTVFLRPQLIARGYPERLVKKAQVWYDPSEVVTRADRSEDADKGYTQMLVSAATWRRAHGFTETDKPSDEEIVKRVALSGSVAPSTTLDFLRQVAPNVVAEAEKLAQEAFGDPDKSNNSSAFTPDDGTPEDDPSAQPSSGASPSDPPPASQDPAAPSTAATPPEGTLPPQFSSDAEKSAAQVLEILHGITAASTRPTPTVRDRQRRLERSLEVERRLRESVAVHLNDVVGRSLEKAGARTISKIRGDAELKSLVSQVSISEVFANIPEERLETFALDGKKLVSDTIEKAKSSYFKLVSEAQDQGWRALGVYDAMKPKQQGLIEKSWNWLAKQLTNIATAWLKNPKKTGNFVNIETVRTATALAGGAELQVVERPAPKDSPKKVEKIETVDPHESGRAVMSVDTLQETGWEFSERYRWVYGISENSFHPHERLDDTIFSSWTDKKLAANPKDFPYVTHHYPGDHTGCRCDWLPEVLDPGLVNFPARGDTSEGELPLVAAASNGSARTSV